MEHAILAEHLAVNYRRKSGETVRAVKDLSFEVHPGEVVGFLGPNGAGKSSTLKALMGFVSPASGVATILGLPAGSERARSFVGYLPEVAMYYPYLTPRETLRLYANLQGIPRAGLEANLTELLGLVGLGELGDRLNRTLSKGQLQRVGIAQSLLGEPSLLILDEVTSGLDPLGRRDLRELLLSRRDNGATLFFSSHELSEVEMLCDRILIIDQGVLLESRVLSELRSELRRYGLVYRGGASMVGLTDRLEELENGRVRALFEDKEGLLAAISRIQNGDGEVLDVVAHDGSLEDYFVDVIGRAA